MTDGRMETTIEGAGLKLRHLAVGYAGTTVLSDITLDLAPGGSLAIVGESGCGKTTLLRTIAGLLPVQTSGNQEAGSIEWHRPSGERLTRPHSGFVWQGLGLLPWKTVRGNLVLPLTLSASKCPKEEAYRLADKLLDELGLTGLEKRLPAQLSGGQRQRLALGRALIARPEVLFMDEPFSALDALRRERLQELLSNLRRRRRVTTIFVTHDIGEAAFLADRVLLLAAAPGRVLELYDNPARHPNVRRPDGMVDRESAAYAEALRHIHSTLRRAASSQTSLTASRD